MRLERFLLHVRLGGPKPESITDARWRAMLRQVVANKLLPAYKFNVQGVLRKAGIV